MEVRKNVKWLTRPDDQNEEKSERKIVSEESDSSLMVHALVDAVELNVVVQIVNRTGRNIKISAMAKKSK